MIDAGSDTCGRVRKRRAVPFAATGLLSLLCVLSRGAAAEPPTSQNVQAWFSRAWNEAQSLPDLGEYSLEWTASDYSSLLNQTPGANASELAGVPYSKPAASIVTFYLASSGERAWRFGVSFPGQPAFVDTVYSAANCWRLSADSLQILDPSRRDDKTDPNATGNGLRSFYVDLTNIMTGGLGIARLSKLVSEPVSVEGQRWSCDAHREVAGLRTYAVRYEGIWLDAEGRGRVVSMRVLQNKYAIHDVDSETRFSAWTHHPELGTELASVVEKHRADGMLERSVRLDGVRRLPTSGLTACLLAPTTGHDPIRGSLSLKQVIDEIQRSATDLSTGSVQSIVANNDAPDVASRWRLWGYAVLGVCTAALLLVRVVRVRRRRVS